NAPAGGGRGVRHAQRGGRALVLRSRCRGHLAFRLATTRERSNWVGDEALLLDVLGDLLAVVLTRPGVDRVPGVQLADPAGLADVVLRGLRRVDARGARVAVHVVDD